MLLAFAKHVRRRCDLLRPRANFSARAWRIGGDTLGFSYHVFTSATESEPAVTPEQRAANDLQDVRFLTVAEVAQLMRVSKMTVYRMIHAGELPAVKFGRSFRVPESSVQEAISGATGTRSA